jgi:hypothetical protein
MNVMGQQLKPNLWITVACASKSQVDLPSQFKHVITTSRTSVYTFLNERRSRTLFLNCIRIIRQLC